MNDTVDCDERAGEASPVHAGRPVMLAAFPALASLVLFLYLVRAMLLPFVLGGIVAFVSASMIDRLARRTGLPRVAWAMATLAALLAVAGLVGFLAGPPFVRELAGIVDDLHGIVERVARAFIGGHAFVLLGTPVDATAIADSVQNGLRRWLEQDGRLFEAAFMGFVGVVGFFVTWVVIGYMLYDAPGIGRDLVALLPPARRALAREIWTELDPILRRYFIGVALVVVYATIVAYVGLGMILGVRDALLLAFLTGLFEIVPIVGPAASAIIAGLFAVQQAAGSWDVVSYLFYAVTLRVSIDQFFSPIVLGKAAYLRPVVVMFCFLSGGLLFGVVGIILAVPTAVAVKVVLAHLYRQEEARVAMIEPDREEKRRAVS